MKPNELTEQLAAPFPPNQVSWRVGQLTKDKKKGMPLAYIDARDVMQRLDDVVGAGNWQCDYTPMPNGTSCCRLGIKFDDEWVWKSNGAGETDFEGQKGQYSDAFKRAAVLWGIGRYLYDIKARWLPVNQYRQFEANDMQQLQRLLPAPDGVVERFNPHQAKKAIDFDSLVTNLNGCATTDMLDEFVRNNQAIVDKMPLSWLPHWNERVATVRDACHAREAA